LMQELLASRAASEASALADADVKTSATTSKFSEQKSRSHRTSTKNLPASTKSRFPSSVSEASSIAQAGLAAQISDIFPEDAEFVERELEELSKIPALFADESTDSADSDYEQFEAGS